MKKFLTQNGLIVLFVIASAMIMTFVVGLTAEDGLRLFGKAIMLALYWAATSLFITFWRTRAFKVEEVISENPIALSIFLGLFSLGSALVVISG